MWWCQPECRWRRWGRMQRRCTSASRRACMRRALVGRIVCISAVSTPCLTSVAPPPLFAVSEESRRLRSPWLTMDPTRSNQWSFLIHRMKPTFTWFLHKRHWLERIAMGPMLNTKWVIEDTTWLQKWWPWSKRRFQCKVQCMNFKLILESNKCFLRATRGSYLQDMAILLLSFSIERFLVSIMQSELSDMVNLGPIAKPGSFRLTATLISFADVQMETCKRQLPIMAS